MTAVCNLHIINGRQHKYGAAVQRHQGKTEVLGEQPVSVPFSRFYLYGDRLVKPGVKIQSLEN
jgi:hypothetical protein